MRAAVMTANLMAMQSSEKVTDQQFQELVQRLFAYLKVNEEPQRVIGPAEAARLAGVR